MLDKLKSFMPLSLVVMGFLFAVYFGYEQYQDKQRYKQEVSNLKNQLEQSQARQQKSDEVVAVREQKKVADRVKINETRVQINNANKDNECANQSMPVGVIDWMRKD